MRRSATRRSPLSTSATCPSVAAGCGLESETAHAYADFALPTPWGYVLLEVDEEQHKAYDPSCDVRRDFDMAASVALGSGHKLLVLRYNPDDTARTGSDQCSATQGSALFSAARS